MVRSLTQSGVPQNDEMHDLTRVHCSILECEATKLNSRHSKATSNFSFDCHNPQNRHDRKETERFRVFAYEELMQRDKVNLGIFWLRDDSLEDSANLPDRGVLAREIAEDLESALDQFSTISQSLKED